MKFLVEEDGREVVIESHAGERVTQAAYRAGVTIQQTCAGKAACTDCRVFVKDNVNDGLEPLTGPELRQLGNVYYITKERLACQAIIKDDVTLFVPRFVRKKDKNKRS